MSKHRSHIIEFERQVAQSLSATRCMHCPSGTTSRSARAGALGRRFRSWGGTVRPHSLAAADRTRDGFLGRGTGRRSSRSAPRTTSPFGTAPIPIPRGQSGLLKGLFGQRQFCRARLRVGKNEHQSTSKALPTINLGRQLWGNEPAPFCNNIGVFTAARQATKSHPNP